MCNFGGQQYFCTFPAEVTRQVGHANHAVAEVFCCSNVMLLVISAFCYYGTFYNVLPHEAYVPLAVPLKLISTL